MVQMLLLVDFLANPLAWLENKKQPKTTDIFGPICLELLKKQNLPGSLGKMSEILLASQTAWYSNKCTLTWKAKVTKSNRLLYQLQQSTHPTNDTEHGLWLTPSATNIDKRSDAALKKRQKYRERIGRTTTNPGNLAEQVQYGFPIKDMMMWPTPTKREYFPPRLPETMAKTNRNPMTNTLGDAVQHLEGKSYKETGQLNPMWVEWLMGYQIGWTDLKD